MNEAARSARPAAPAVAAPVGPRRPRVPVLVTVAAAVLLAGAWLAAPPLGTDLSAQLARAEFFADHGWAVIDFRWYGGVSPLGYSLVAPPLMAWFGVRPVGAVAAVVSAWALVSLLSRTGARRLPLAGVLAAACFTGNLVSGRVTFAIGVAFGLLALLALVSRTPLPAGRRTASTAAAGLLAALASATSPVAGLFLLLAGVAILAGGGVRAAGGGGARAASSGRAGGAALLVGAGLPLLALATAFSAGGWMNMSRSDMLHATVTSLAVAALVPRRTVRIGALLSAGGVVAAYLLPTAVGLNATRLATMFALPLVAGYAVVPAWLRRPVLRPAYPAVVLAALFLWQPPVIYQDLRGAGAPAAEPGFHAPLAAELARRPLPGRVEVVPTAGYWEVAYLDELPLARGWLRQADLDRNRLFFDGSLDADSYRRWLSGAAVSYVAVPAAPVSWVGREEAELVRGGLPYLTLVWSNRDWSLYEVEDAVPLVTGPAGLVDQTGASVRFEATGPGEVLVRVHWSRWLAVSGPDGACLEPAGRWTLVRVDGPGEYALSGSVSSAGPRCPA